MANKGQFYGVGRQKAGRRANRPNGSPRKVYAYTRKDQRGTPMEQFINNNYASLDQQRNATNPTVGRMSQKEATGQLSSTWRGVNRKGMGAKAVIDHIRKNGVTAAQANKALMGQHEVSFGADPKVK